MELNEKDQQFVQAMRDVVAEMGEGYQYPKGEPGFCSGKAYDPVTGGTVILDTRCLYVNILTGEPACIIGKALAKCGVKPEELKLHEYTPAIGVLGKLGFGPEVQRAAREAQGAQDDGARWGRALELFEEQLLAQVPQRV